MKDYVIVTALEQEFPFKEDFNILYTGAGKVNASISLLSYLYDNPNIKNVINVGTAGGVSVDRHQVYECGIYIQGDIMYPSYELETLTFHTSKYTLSTFDSFQKSLPERKCDLIDMEGFAFAKICKLKKVNFFCFKYISDIVGDNQQEVDWIENYHKGRFLLKESVMKLL
jgi:adenosylhomocysteine nucleosidase